MTTEPDLDLLKEHLLEDADELGNGMKSANIRAAVDALDRLRAELASQREAHEAEIAALTAHRDALQEQDERNLAEMDVLATERDGLAATIKQAAHDLGLLSSRTADYTPAGVTIRIDAIRAALSTQDGDTDD